MRSSRVDASAGSEALGTEWCLLQNQFDSYEKYSLLLKMGNIALVALALMVGAPGLFLLALVIIVWLQDAIWKTFQARIEVRLLQIEVSAADRAAEPAADSPGRVPFQFNSEYNRTRGDTASLMAEYARQALRPTVAFPHVVLAVLYCLYLFSSLI
ncbi:hypothetical protein [Allohahella marinimesophila]|uniref:Uncharacterized protein n=1 Tax=Allohahella marinimesophila TaxID=1054972 RepID=A0ABP7P0K6_9GAMM